MGKDTGTGGGDSQVRGQRRISKSKISNDQGVVVDQTRYPGTGPCGVVHISKVKIFAESYSFQSRVCQTQHN